MNTTKTNAECGVEEIQYEEVNKCLPIKEIVNGIGYVLFVFATMFLAMFL